MVRVLISRACLRILISRATQVPLLISRATQVPLLISRAPLPVRVYLLGGGANGRATQVEIDLLVGGVRLRAPLPVRVYLLGGGVISRACLSILKGPSFSLCEGKVLKGKPWALLRQVRSWSYLS